VKTVPERAEHPSLVIALLHSHTMTIDGYVATEVDEVVRIMDGEHDEERHAAFLPQVRIGSRWLPA
jgi:hypothetical protein